MKIKDSIDINEYIYFKTSIWGLVNSLEICFLMAQKVKNPPAKQDTWVRSLGWEDLLEEGMAKNVVISTKFWLYGNLKIDLFCARP